MMRILVLGMVLLMACERSGQVVKEEQQPMSPAEKVFIKAFEEHGGDKYDQADYKFVFRDKQYHFRNDGDAFEYEVKYEKNDTAFIDYLDNDGFTRKANGAVLELSEKKANSGREALNSVIYFATLPHKLYDEAVNKEYRGEMKIGNAMYDVLGVTFDEEGGGDDHQDNYRYWINKQTGRIDFLAYDYVVNEGGVRFREAGNPRVVDGILFQDYVNYKAELGTALDSLPAMWARGELKKLSEINTEDVRVSD